MTALTTLSPERLALRRSRITATDAAAILGVSRWKTAYDVWAEKTGKLDGRPEPSEAMEWGVRLESAVLDWGAERLGTTITRDQWRAGTFLGASLDAITAEGEPLEGKTAGIVHRGATLDDWGPDGSDQIPDEYVVQVTVQMIVTGAEVAHLAALIGGAGARLYRIPRSRRLSQIIEDRAGAFWRDHIERDIPPEHSLPSEETVRRIRRVPDKIAVLDPLECAEFAAARQARIEAEDREAAARVKLLASLRDCDAGAAPGWNVSFHRITTRKLDQLALGERFPEAVKECTIESVYRRLSVRQDKGDSK